MTREKPRGALIGAYGLFWDREWVEFDGFGPRNVPLYGVQAGPSRSPVINVAAATACYVLYNDYGPVYTGISDTGLGRRLKEHDRDAPRGHNWTRFSWFAFGDVRPMTGRDSDGWAAISRKTRPEPTNPEANVRELEALLIQLLGLRQNQMTFQRADKWDQVDFYEAQGLVDDRLVAEIHFPAKWKRRWARERLVDGGLT